MNRFKQEYYANIDDIARTLDRIANALENNNKEDKIYYKTRKDMFMDNPCTKKEYEASKQEAHNVKHAFTGMDGTQVDEAIELDIQHDYLHQLLKNLTMNEYQEFCNEHCLPVNDTVAVSNYITDLDYDEVLGIIKDLEASNDLSIRYKNKIKEFPKSDDQANEDAIKELDVFQPLLWPNCPDLDIRKTARMYTEELEAGINFRTKKECILDYITNEFGSQGARYTDIIKFAYYLNNSNSPKFDSTRDRGYYACALTHNRWKHGHLVYGGKDFLVKGINKEGNERYFAHSFVESVTDYWKYCDNTKKDSNNPNYNYF